MHALLEREARLLGPARFAGRLYDLGAYPGVVDGASRDVVHGELWELDPVRATEALEALDRYEGRVFERVVREVVLGDGRRLDAFVYLFRGEVRAGRRIRSGDYLEG